MEVVNIFVTNASAGAMPDFVHEDTQYVFDSLDIEGPRRLVEGPTRIFVDWVMEGLAGLEMCRRLRADPRLADAHVTMVLEDDDPDDCRRALKAGADDYIVGPVDRTRILDRVLAVHARSNTRNLASRFVLDKLTIDTTALQARWDRRLIGLRPNEFRLLRFFAENPDRVLSRDEIIAGLGKHEPPIDERTVDVWVGRLRRALKEAGAGDLLRTVRARGYAFDTP